jgi:hypothetical protein
MLAAEHVLRYRADGTPCNNGFEPKDAKSQMNDDDDENPTDKKICWVRWMLA